MIGDALYIEANDDIALFHVLSTIYVHKTTNVYNAVRYHMRDMYHKDLGVWNIHMIKNLTNTWEELQYIKIKDRRDNFPVHPYFYPIIYQDKIENPDQYI